LRETGEGADGRGGYFFRITGPNVIQDEYFCCGHLLYKGTCYFGTFFKREVF
jgi:hypothetical protein